MFKKTKNMNHKFIKTINSIFNLKFCNYNLSPIELKNDINFPDQTKRLNHYCIKLNNCSNFEYGDLDKETIKGIKYFISFLPSCLNIKDRYCYITIDNKPVRKGSSQRVSGLHIDGLQGNEVPTKKEGDFSLIWMNKLPTQYVINPSIPPLFNLSKKNFFNYLNKKKFKVKSLKTCTLYLINSYMIHQSVISKVDQDRLFIRISFSKIPVTSIKMNKNNSLCYNYNIHTTTGNIPAHLK